MNELPWAQEFAALVDETLSTYEAPGTAVAFAENGRLVYARGFGFADREAGIAVTPEHIFGAASITKSFTCLSIMQLAEAGKLSVNDPVVRYLPEFRLPDEHATQTATIGHFMNHTAALPPLPLLTSALVPSQKGDPVVEEFAADYDAASLPPCDTIGDVFAYLAKGEFSLTGQPGEMMSYSNDAYVLLGEIITRVSGKPYRQYMHEHIFSPLGLSRTTFDLNETRRLGDRVQLYARDKKGAVRPSPLWEDHEVLGACGMLRSTVLDLTRYAAMYANDGVCPGDGTCAGRRLLSAEGVAAMRQPRCFTGRDTWYGYGLHMNPQYHGVSLVGHSGGLKGVSSYFGFVPERGLAGAVITNLAGVPARRLWLNGINGLLGLPLTTPWTVEPEYDMPLSEKERFVGTYPSGEGNKIHIELEDGQLYFGEGDKRIPLRASGPDTVVYRDKDQDSVIRLITDATGVVTGVHAGSRFIRKAQ